MDCVTKVAGKKTKIQKPEKQKYWGKKEKNINNIYFDVGINFLGVPFCQLTGLVCLNFFGKFSSFFIWFFKTLLIVLSLI